MGSDAFVNTRVSAFNKNSSKNKRGIKQGKLKQSKFDVRSEQQRFFQVNKKEQNLGKNKVGGTLPLSIPKSSQTTSARKHKHEIPTAFNKESVSWTNGQIVRRLDHNGLRKDFYRSRNSSCSGSCSSSCSEADRDEGCLDDWEAVADALTAENNQQTSNLERHVSKTEASGVNCRYQGNARAWSRDDAYRPRSLPTISKPNIEHCFSRGPSACPICCEDFDVTDSSFLPCPCGFRICLFCHNRILEVDGRCPGCRKQYNSVNTDAALPVQTDAALPVQTTDTCMKNAWF